MNCEVLYEVVMTYAVRSLHPIFQKKNPDVFSTAHLRWKWDTFTTVWDIHVAVTMENIPWVTHFGSPASELTHFFLLPQIQEAIMPRPRWTTHISPWIISQRPKPRLCINLEDKVITINSICHIYIFFLCVYNICIYIYIFDKGLGCQWRVNVTLQMWSLVIPRGAGQASPTVSQDL